MAVPFRTQRSLSARALTHVAHRALLCAVRALAVQLWEHKPGVVDLSLGKLADGAQRDRLEQMSRGDEAAMPAYFAIHTKLFKVLKGDGLTYAIDLFHRILEKAGVTSEDDDEDLKHACVQSAEEFPPATLREASVRKSIGG